MTSIIFHLWELDLLFHLYGLAEGEWFLVITLLAHASLFDGYAALLIRFLFCISNLKELN